jgi:hypothetical protein
VRRIIKNGVLRAPQMIELPSNPIEIELHLEIMEDWNGSGRQHRRAGIWWDAGEESSGFTVLEPRHGYPSDEELTWGASFDDVSPGMSLTAAVITQIRPDLHWMMPRDIQKTYAFKDLLRFFQNLRSDIDHRVDWFELMGLAWELGFPPVDQL